MQLYVCLYDRVALPKGTNQNLSMRSLQIQWDQEIVKVLSDLKNLSSISAVSKKNLGPKQKLLESFVSLDPNLKKIEIQHKNIMDN